MERPIASNGPLRGGILAALVLAASFVPRAAAAQAPASAAPTAEDAARAQALFDEARDLMKDERFAEACPKLEQSQVLDPGGGTMLNLGICRLREGRTATALAVLSDALAQARAADRRDRIATAERHLAELTPILSHLTVRSSAGTFPPDLVVELDGTALAPERLGSAFPLDPGPHEVRASQPGRVSFTAKLVLGARADAQTVDVPSLEPVAPVVAPVANPPPGQKAEPAPAPVRKDVSGTGPNWLGYGIAGAGGAAMLVGGYFGLRALSLKAKSDQDFDGQHCETQGCVDDWESAKDAALVSNVCFGVGAAALGVGVYLILSSPKSNENARAASFSIRAAPGGARATGSIEF